MIKKNKEMLWDLALNDFSTKYAGSYLGIFWAFVQPIITIIVYWCVFEFGLKAQTPIENVPYILWFATGMVPWFFFSDGVNATTNSLLEYSYLVKKVVFDIELLPIIKILSTLFIHVVFVMLLIIVAMASGEGLSIYFIQVFYYMFAMIVLIYGIGKLTAAIILFFRDLGQIVSIVLQIGVWATPIIWPYTIIAEEYQWVAKINPMFYIVEGYRNCFFDSKWFFESPCLTVYYWIVTLLILFCGSKVFSKLKPHFADVI